MPTATYTGANMSAFSRGQNVRINATFPNKCVHGSIVKVLGTDGGRTFPIRTTVPSNAPPDCTHLGEFRFRESELEPVA